jgi:hypothetical protein
MVNAVQLIMKQPVIGAVVHSMVGVEMRRKTQMAHVYYQIHGVMQMVRVHGMDYMIQQMDD